MRIVVALMLVLVVLLAGCGGSKESQQSTPSAGAPSPSGGLTVQEAIDSDLTGPLMVRGYLIERAGELRLCSAILESYPPQCGEPSLRLRGDDLEPSERQTSLLGTVERDSFVVSKTSR